MFEMWKEERLDALYEKHPNAAAHIRKAYIEIYNLQALTPKPAEDAGRLKLVEALKFAGGQLNFAFPAGTPGLAQARMLSALGAIRKALAGEAL